MQNERYENRAGRRRVFLTELEVLLYDYDLADINFGSNPDEYAIEAKALLTRLHTQSTEEEIKQIVYEIFVAYFSKLCIPQKEHHIYNALSKEIDLLWQNYIAQGLKGPSIYDFMV